MFLVFLSILFTGCGEKKSIQTASGTDYMKHQKQLANLVFNGDFEHIPKDWNTKNQSLNNVTGWTTEDAHSGSHSLEIKNVSQTDAYWEGASIVPKKSISSFEASVWTRTKNIKEGAGKFELAFDVYLENENAAKRVTIYISQTNHSWEQAKGRFSFGANIIKIIPYIYFSWNTGTVFVDDLRIVSF